MVTYGYVVLLPYFILYLYNYILLKIKSLYYINMRFCIVPKYRLE